MRKFEVPLGEPYTGRTSAENVSDTTSGYVGIGIVGLMIVGKSSLATTKDARNLNCFRHTIKDSAGNTIKKYMVKRPGWETYNTPSSGNVGVAILIWIGGSQAIITAFGSTTSTIYSGASSLGAITGKATGITETKLGALAATATLAVTSDDSTAWYYDTGVGVMTQIASGNFPGNAGLTLAGTFAHADGYACVMTTDGRLWASDLNSITAWTATSFESANAYPDGGIGCVRHRSYILAFGPESFQVFQNAGLTPFPFAKVESLTRKVGCVSHDAIAQIADTTFWCGSTPQGGLSIFQYDTDISRISTPEVDSFLLLAGASNINLTSIRQMGLSFVVVASNNNTYVYCLEEKYWFEWSSTTNLWYKIVGISAGATMINYSISKVATGGKVYKQNNALLVFTDDGVAYTARVQTAPQGIGREVYHELEILADREASASAITLSYSDDDYQSYSTWGNLDLSDVRPRATRLGRAARPRAFVLTHSAATPMRLERLIGKKTDSNV